MSALQDKTVVLGVTGGISAYKAAELVRLLRKAGADVRVIMTDAACEFITPLTLQTLSGHPVARGLFDPAEEADIGHIHLADSADLLLIAPATADVIARMAAGMANDLLTTVALATQAPVVLVPAMNVNMWEHPLTQANLERLIGTGRVTTIGPDAGPLACGWIGAGRLVEPTEIVASLEKVDLLRTFPRGSLAGRRVVVTAGPTHEPLDDVRYIGNRSSGKMGFAIAAVAARRGADVTLIAGPVALPTPRSVSGRTDVQTALEMQAALTEACREVDIVVMTAAVADFRPAIRTTGKLSRRDGIAAIDLVANPDLLAELGSKPGSTVRSRQSQSRPVLVGFAAEVGLDTSALVSRARAKLTEKGCDVVVANDVGVAGLGFGSEESALVMVFADGRTVTLGRGPKTELAEGLWDQLMPLLPPPRSAQPGDAQPEDAKPGRRRHLQAT